MRDWAGPDEALDAATFERLYRGALLLESGVDRVRAATLALLTGRLGLTLDEALHLHEGWIDWERAVVDVPAKDPCACDACWETARQRREHTDPILEVLYEECWSPPADREPRIVPFGWSRRISAALATTADRFLLDLPPADARDLLADAADAADGLAGDDVTPDALAATTTRFLADLTLESDQTARVLGVSSTAVEPYYDDAPDLATRLSRLAGADDRSVADPAADFPVACGGDSFPSEPFDLSAGERDALAERAADAVDPERIPRPTDLPATVEYDPADHAAAGGPVRRRTEEPPAEAANAPAGGPGHVVDAMGDGVGQATDLSRANEADAREANGSPQPRAAADPAHAGDPPTRVTGADDAETTPSPRDVVTQPVVADVVTRVAADGVCGGRAVSCRVVLGQEELFVLRTEEGEPDDPDAPNLVVPLRTVWDVRIDHVPGHFDAAFPRSVTVTHRPDATDQNAIAVQLPATQRRDLAVALYRLLLNVTPVSVTDPARVGGRVTGTEPEPAVMYVRSNRVVFGGQTDESKRCAFDLDDVVHVDRTDRPVGGETQRVVEVRRVTGNRPVTTAISTPDERLQRLAWRYVRREYHRTLADVRDLRLSDPEKMILVALYSTDGTPDLDAILGLNEQELTGALQSLSAKDLVRTAAASTSLTGRGQLVVSDRLDSVND